MQHMRMRDPDLSPGEIFAGGGPRLPERDPEDMPTPSRVPMEEPDDGDPTIDPSVREPPMLPGDRPVILPPD